VRSRDEAAGSTGGSAAPPFSRGSVSIRLYPHNELEPDAIVSELCGQARLALGCGFDGVMTSEHHGGFAGYLAQPLQMAAFVLEECNAGWAAAAPLLLPLRATALVAEEVAWLNVRHPGRVGVGVAAGALPLDFEVAQVDASDAVRLFKEELPRLAAMLRGEALGDLAGDPALRACRRSPVPVLSAAVSPAAARRAARCGAGILMEGMSDAARLATLTEAFDSAGGNGSKVLIRRVWLGDPQTDLVRSQRAVYDSYSGGTAGFGEDQTIASTEPEEVLARLRDLVVATNTDALNLRVHLPGIPPEAVRDQIEALGSEVVGPLKDRWPAV
jgi:alkanesulfonate monooxygenase SsuD/methylene tetrahydromethanopterin reductase-like flavin-dependent oxidoreductase (luciferase family)